MPALLDDSNFARTHNLGLEAAMTYLTATDEVKADVDTRIEAGDLIKTFRCLTETVAPA